MKSSVSLLVLVVGGYFSVTNAYDHLTGVEMMKNDIHFELYSRHKGFNVSLAALLQCLRIAEVYGHTAQIEPSWWKSITSTHLDGIELMVGLCFGEHK